MSLLLPNDSVHNWHENMSSVTGLLFFMCINSFLCLCSLLATVDSMNMGSLREGLMMPSGLLHNLHEDEDEDELDTEMMIMGQTPGSFTKKSTHLAGRLGRLAEGGSRL